MKKREFQKKCPCCNATFTTNRIDKKYINHIHQIRYNNYVQSEKRRIENEKNSPLNKTFRIYDELLGSRNTCLYSEDYLRGKGADLKLFTSIIENEKRQKLFVLFSISLEASENKIRLTRLK